MPDLRFWRWRRRQDADIDRELEVHLDLATDERADAGAARREAQLEARREFGNRLRTTETLREMRVSAPLERLLANAAGDFRHGFRLLARTPGFTAAAILILALPICVNTVVFSLVNAVLLQPRPGRIDSLVALYSRDRDRPDSYRDFSYPLYVDLRDRSAAFENLMAHTIALVGIRDGDATRRSFAGIVSSNYFATLGVPLVAAEPSRSTKSGRPASRRWPSPRMARGASAASTPASSAAR